MPSSSFTAWVWRLSAITTAIYAVVFFVDFGIHLHEGWSEGCRKRDRILEARSDCDSTRFKSAVIQERCAQVQSAPLVVPWHVAFHHVGRHLSAKMASMLQSLVILVLLLVPIALGVFWCAMRSQHQRHPQQPAGHLHPSHVAASLAALWSQMASPSGSSSGSSSTPPAAPPPSPRPKSCVVELPSSSTRQRKRPGEAFG